MLATHNQGKIREFRDLLASIGADAVPAAQLGLAAPEETGADFAANALLKARHCCSETGLPALADDSGLCIDALGGEPGVRSADWAEAQGGRDFDLAIAKVYDRLKRADAAKPVTARFVTVLCVAWPDGAAAHYRGAVEGRIACSKRGGCGFGYDPIFIPDGDARTFGEMSREQKNAISHRAKAIARFIDGRTDES